MPSATLISLFERLHQNSFCIILFLHTKKNQVSFFHFFSKSENCRKEQEGMTAVEEFSESSHSACITSGPFTMTCVPWKMRNGLLMALSIGLQRSNLSVGEMLRKVAWSRHGGPCTNCLVYGFMPPDCCYPDTQQDGTIVQLQYPGDGRGICTTHLSGSDKERMSNAEIHFFLERFVAEYQERLASPTDDSEDEEEDKYWLREGKEEEPETEIVRRARRRIRAREKKRNKKSEN